jgi:hypothetical protein
MAVSANYIALGDFGQETLFAACDQIANLGRLHLTGSVVKVHALRRKAAPTIHAWLILQSVRTLSPLGDVPSPIASSPLRIALEPSRVRSCAHARVKTPEACAATVSVFPVVAVTLAGVESSRQ